MTAVRRLGPLRSFCTMGGGASIMLNYCTCSLPWLAFWLFAPKEHTHILLELPPYKQWDEKSLKTASMFLFLFLPCKHPLIPSPYHLSTYSHVYSNCFIRIFWNWSEFNFWNSKRQATGRNNEGLTDWYLWLLNLYYKASRQTATLLLSIIMANN